MSAQALGVSMSAVHQQMACAHWMKARWARERTIAPQCIKRRALQARLQEQTGRIGAIRPHWLDWNRLQAVIHVEFDRMRRHAEPCDLFHLERDISFEHVVRENPAASQKFVVLLEIVESFVERRA